METAKENDPVCLCGASPLWRENTFKHIWSIIDICFTTKYVGDFQIDIFASHEFFRLHELV